MSDVAIITANMGGYDRHHGCPPGYTDAVYVTDDPDLVIDGWRMVYEPPNADLERRMQAKRVRCFPWNYTDAEVVVWVDACYALHDPPPDLDSFVPSDVALCRHNQRDDVRDELYEAGKLARYANMDFDAMFARYGSLPKPSGLWGAGVVMRRRTTKALEFGAAWWDEIQRFGPFDQPMIVWVCHVLGLVPDVLPWALLDNPIGRWNRHARDDY